MTGSGALVAMEEGDMDAYNCSTEATPTNPEYGAVPGGPGIGYPKGIDPEEFLPWGEDGELVVVRGTVPDEVLLRGALAAEVDLTSWLEAADGLDEPPVPWYGDDEDKPDDVWHAEVAAAYAAQHSASVRHGWALFWDRTDPEDPDSHYREGGVRLSETEKPGYVRATWLTKR